MYKPFLTFFLVFITYNALAEEIAYKPRPAPEVLHHFISLEGKWTGSHINHAGEEEQVNLEYRTVSGGTAVEERIFADTPKEMITVYHGDGNDKLLMTHYCMLGNQPRLQLGAHEGNRFDFHYLDGAGIDREKTGHMGRMRMTIIDENTFEQEWAYFENGEELNVSKFVFVRD